MDMNEKQNNSPLTVNSAANLYWKYRLNKGQKTDNKVKFIKLYREALAEAKIAKDTPVTEIDEFLKTLAYKAYRTRKYDKYGFAERMDIIYELILFRDFVNTTQGKRVGKEENFFPQTEEYIQEIINNIFKRKPLEYIQKIYYDTETR